MKVNVIFFGQLEQLANCKSKEFESVHNTEELKQQVAEQFPQLAEFDYLIALNQEIVRENSVIADQDEVALLPPFAGG